MKNCRLPIIDARTHLLLGLLGSASALVPCANAQLAIDFSFDPSQTGGVCGLTGAADVWAYGCNGSTIEHYASDGTFLGSIPRPGNQGDDADLDVVGQSMMLGGVSVPAGSLLHFDGETGVCEVYALDPVSGVVIASLVTQFGASHVVGGCYCPTSDSIYLLQDSVPAAGVGNQLAQIDPSTGAVLSAFFPIASGFSTFYGDVDVSHATGDLYLVSSAESDIAIFEPGGALKRLLPLPSGVGGLSGIGLDDSSGDAWVSANWGTIWRLTSAVEIGAGYCTPAVANSSGAPALTRAYGSELVASNRLRLVAFQLPANSNGYFITSLTQNVVVGPGGSQGILCLGGTIGRLNAPGQVFNSASVGRAELDLDLTQIPTPSTGFIAVVAGQTWNYQAWYRDSNPGPTNNFTDATSVTFM